MKINKEPLCALLFAVVCSAFLTLPGLAADKENQEDKVECSQMKTELREKYKLAPKADGADEMDDTKVVLKELEGLLSKKISSKSKTQESPEAAMNYRMEVANLEYEIDHLGDFIPEIKTKKENLRKEVAKQEEADNAPPYKVDSRKMEKTYVNSPVKTNHKK